MGVLSGQGYCHTGQGRKRFAGNARRPVCGSHTGYHRNSSQSSNSLLGFKYLGGYVKTLANSGLA